MFAEQTMEGMERIGATQTALQVSTYPLTPPASILHTHIPYILSTPPTV